MNYSFNIVRMNLKASAFYLLILSSLIVIFAFHLFTFTLFEGFATFSSDAGQYLLMARKWSPFYAPSYAELNTWPLASLPPAFSWTMAFTGASESLWSAHLLVSISMLASVLLIGWMLYRQLGWLVGGLVTISLCLLPGVVFSSMGILSENQYLLLSLLVLGLYRKITESKINSVSWFILLALCLSLTVLTRTVGLALIAALSTVSLTDQSLSLKKKIGLQFSIFSSIVFWLLWGTFAASGDEVSYIFLFKQQFGSELTFAGALSIFWDTFTSNLVTLVSSWNAYTTLTHPNFLFFLFSFGLLIACIIGMSLRILLRKPDAIYLLFYLAIIMVWPHPDQMTRFLHPIVFLICVQPLLWLAENQNLNNTKSTKWATIAVVLSLIVISASMHLRLLEKRDAATSIDPGFTHVYEIYDSPATSFDLHTASNYLDIQRFMQASAIYAPDQGVVATVKPVNFAILTGKHAVYLVSTVPYEQQLCNLQVKDVDVIFLSDLVTQYNMSGKNNAAGYQDVSSEIWTLEGGISKSTAYSIVLDKEKLKTRLQEVEYDCQSYKTHM